MKKERSIKMKDEKGRGKGVVMKVIKRKIIVCNLFFAIAF
jgi:hypothetical protein